jgi:LacI family transcriptional regulator
MSNITIRMLAKELKLSVATISKALRDSHEISAETKNRVYAKAKELNYVPNLYASSLRSRKSKTIAVVLPEVADSFFSIAINGIEAVAQEKGYHVMIYLTHEKFNREVSILKEFQSGRVDGILMSVSCETVETDHIKSVRDKGIPVVFFDRVCEDIPTAKVATNDLESGYEATKHLIEQGCRKIALLSISPSLSISNNRREGYKQALAEHNIKYRKILEIQCSDDLDDNYGIIKNLLKGKFRPDGLLATFEKLTTSIYLVSRDLNLKIPQDIKVVCFTNVQAASILAPPLTTVLQPAFEMGKAAAGILFKALEKKNYKLESQSLVISSKLIVRESTSCDVKYRYPSL